MIRWVLFSIFLLPHLARAERFLVIGDSLSKEYELEFPILFPDNTATWSQRNWLELLAERRSSVVDIGPLSLWPDSRLTGHEYNFAFPGSQTSEWEDILTATIFNAPEKVLLRLSFDSYLRNKADRVVIFLGGNDLKNNYGTYYNGASPTAFVASLVRNLRTIVDYVREKNSRVPVVLVNLPDVGVTPTVIASKPDAAKRKLVSDLTREANNQLKALAEQRGIGYADIASLVDELTGDLQWVIGGISFIKASDPQSLSNRPRYLFAPDGFHPNSPAHLLIANRIVAAFATRYPQLARIEPFSSEEMLRILKIDPDLSFAEWTQGYGLTQVSPEADSDGDGVSDFLEYALGLDPGRSDGQEIPAADWKSDRLVLDYQPRLKESRFFLVTPETSINLRDWQPAAQSGPDNYGRWRAEMLPTNSTGFLRLKVQPK